MKKTRLFIAVVLLLSVLLIGLITIVGYVVLSEEKQKSFYVGVTYCGSSVEEAKELVDKVKDCTNFFVLQSGSLMGDTEAMEEIGDYVVASNISYAVMGSVYDHVGLSRQVLSGWLIEAKERWGERFIGVYYNDEPGGSTVTQLKHLSLNI
ncbi:MAG: hypothetical protein FWC30_01860 [Candidatus Bathyarchaeota archaeon]|nr:hypothetical protein [Candidatus Termiticorpusculum sp.]